MSIEGKNQISRILIVTAIILVFLCQQAALADVFRYMEARQRAEFAPRYMLTQQNAHQSIISQKNMLAEESSRMRKSSKEGPTDHEKIPLKKKTGFTDTPSAQAPEEINKKYEYHYGDIYIESAREEDVREMTENFARMDVFIYGHEISFWFGAVKDRFMDIAAIIDGRYYMIRAKDTLAFECYSESCFNANGAYRFYEEDIISMYMYGVEYVGHDLFLTEWDITSTLDDLSPAEPLESIGQDSRRPDLSGGSDNLLDLDAKSNVLLFDNDKDGAVYYSDFFKGAAESLVSVADEEEDPPLLEVDASLDGAEAASCEPAVDISPEAEQAAAMLISAMASPDEDIFKILEYIFNNIDGLSAESAELLERIKKYYMEFIKEFKIKDHAGAEDRENILRLVEKVERHVDLVKKGKIKVSLDTRERMIEQHKILRRNTAGSAAEYIAGLKKNDLAFMKFIKILEENGPDVYKIKKGKSIKAVISLQKSITPCKNNIIE